MPAIQIGAPAPPFSFLDDEGHERALADFLGSPLILVFGPAGQRSVQPVVQQLTFEGERLTVVAPADKALAIQYGIAYDSPAVFVIAATGRIAWRHMAAESAVDLPSTLSGLSRREFIAAVLAASVAATFVSGSAAAAPANSAFETPLDTASELVRATLVVNGRSTRLALDPRVTLLDALREHLQLTATKKGCDHGQCGACTVHVDGRRVLSCLTLAGSVDGKSISTIEGVAAGDKLHPMQQAFIDHDGLQCGYCTAGQIMSAIALLGEPCGPADDDVRECMSGNICRCGAYPGIVAAVQTVRGNRS